MLQTTDVNTLEHTAANEAGKQMIPDWRVLKCYYRPTASLQLNNKRNTKYNITVT